MPGRPLNDESEERGGSRSQPRGQVPFGALLLIATVTVVFIYGIVLKATGPAPSDRAASTAGAPRAPLAGAATRPDEAGRSTVREATSRANADDPFGEAGETHETPILPEPSSAPDEPAATPPGPNPDAPPVPAPSPRDPFRERESPAPAEPAAQARAAAPPSTRAASPGAAPPQAAPAPASPAPSAPGAAPARDTAPAASPASTPAPPPREPSVAPRGSAPAAARRKARELTAAKNYSGAAQAWNDWARTVPPSSWTVQVAAVRLDNARPSGPLDSLLGRDEAFVLPPGALPNGLSPVCIGTYDSEQAARRAAAAMGRPAGASGPPIVKPLSSLRPR